MCECVTKARGSILGVTQWPEGGHWLRGRLTRKGERGHPGLTEGCHHLDGPGIRRG